MKRLLIAGAAFGSLLASGAGYAADIAPVYKAPPAVAPGYDWTGFYIGLNAGYAWGHSDVTSNFTCPNAVLGCTYQVPANLAGIGAAASGTLSPSGFAGGGQAGYNWQTGSVVFGIEGDIEALHLHASRTVAAPIPTAAAVGLSSPNFAVSTGVKTDWMATIRGRLGFTVTPTVLIYATGGWAVTDLQVTNSFLDNLALFPPFGNSSGASTATQTRSGWTVGGGLEWALSRNWTVRGEYLYVNFGSVTTTANVVNPPIIALGAVPNLLTTSANLTAQIARASVNFRF
jgi:outer membrane immunogenic protein